MDSIALSVIIPLYNEAARVQACLTSLSSWLDARDVPCEVIAVDDGSQDQTSNLLAEWQRRCKWLRLLGDKRNRGKGYAVRQGVAASRGRQILMTDVDLSTPLSEFPKLACALDRGAQLAIGSRAVKGALLLHHQPWLREMTGRAANRLIQFVLPTLRGLGDTQCGFKLYDGAAARMLFAQSRMDRWGFDFEVIHLFVRAGLKVEEIPVSWSHCHDSRVSLGHYLYTLYELLAVCWGERRGRYPPKAIL